MNDFGLRGIVYALWFFVALSAVSCGGCLYQAAGLRIPVQWIGWSGED